MTRKSGTTETRVSFFGQLERRATTNWKFARSREYAFIGNFIHQYVAKRCGQLKDAASSN